MQLKQYLRYQMDFNSKWIRNSALLMGASFFARILYCFGLSDVLQFGIGAWIFQLVLPFMLCIGYIILLSAVKWNAPGVYAILGMVFCLCIIIWNGFSGDILRILLSIVFYATASVALLATAGGFLPGKLLPSIIMAGLFAFRILIYGGTVSGADSWVLEVSVLSLIASLYFLPLGFVPIQPSIAEDDHS